MYEKKPRPVQFLTPRNLTVSLRPKNPIIDTVAYCARAASGQAAAPPSSMMNWRLFTRSPRRRRAGGIGRNMLDISPGPPSAEHGVTPALPLSQITQAADRDSSLLGVGSATIVLIKRVRQSRMEVLA